MRARLSYNDLDGKPVTVELSPDTPVTLGRSRDNTVVLRDEHASRMHARVHFDQGQWRVRDFGLNGTRVNGVKVDQESPLRHGDELRVGDTRMQFAVLEAAPGGPSTKRIAIPPPEAPPSTRLQPDDLTTLCNFMAAAVRETEPSALLRQALETVLHQTGAYVVGFLSDDPNDPVTKMVVPDSAHVDVQLSKELIKRAHRDGRAVWLCSDVANTRTPESLANYSDALCLPVRTAGRALGTLHAYRSDAYFAERDLRFCEALAGYLAGGLHLLRSARTLAAENTRLRGHLPAGEEMVGDSAKIRELRDIIARVAAKARTVLVHGETGAGKELVAVALHRQSGRPGPLVAVNCAAIPASLMEAELFGYRKGAFSGAEHDYDGLFGQAEEGTLFLDEVADLSLDCQAKLLRAVDGRGYRRVGDTRERPADVQLVAATHRDLGEEVRLGRFRNDLYYRLNVVTVEVPPLRGHREDIPHLTQFFLDKLSAEHHRQYRLSDAALARLVAFDWPGNVRQLRAVLENAAVMSAAEMLDVADLRLDGAVPETAEVSRTPSEPVPLDLGRLERWAVIEALKRSGGNKKKAAELLGINRTTLYEKIERFGLGPDQPAATAPP